MHNYTAFKWFAGDVSSKPDRPAGLELSGLTTEVTPSVCVWVCVCVGVYMRVPVHMEFELSQFLVCP